MSEKIEKNSTQKKALSSFAELRERARELGGKRRVAVVVADDQVALSAAAGALEQGIAVPVLVGDEARIRAKAKDLNLDTLLAKMEIVATENTSLAAADAAVKMAREGSVDVLLKGHLRTDELLKAVLNKETGLRTGRLLNDVLLFEDTLAGYRRLVAVTDGGLNFAPTLEQKKQIIHNTIEVLKALGFERPKFAVVSATEVVSPNFQSTVDAEELTKMCAAGEFGDAVVFGPVAFDGALIPEAAKAKGIKFDGAGYADCIVVPNIEAGNLLGKSTKYLGGSQNAHVVVGAKVPVLIPSRVESADDKINAIAMGVIYAAR
jgi:phosphate butyryltransferase